MRFIPRFLVSFVVILTMLFVSCDDNEDCSLSIDAGQDQMVEDDTITTLDANELSDDQTGTWSIVSGSGGEIGDVSDPHTVFSGVGGGSYVLRWTLMAVDCPVVQDDVTITFSDPCANSLVSAGSDLLSGGSFVTLEATRPIGSTGLWSIVSGVGGIIADPTNPITTFSGAPETTYVLKWTVILESCDPEEDELQVTFTSNPQLGSVNQTGFLSGELITVTGVNFASNYAGTSQLKMVKTDDPNTGTEVYIRILKFSTTEITGVVGWPVGGYADMDLYYNQRLDVSTTHVFPSDISFAILEPSETDFIVSATFSDKQVAPDETSSVGVKNGGSTASAYTVVLASFNYLTGLAVEYPAIVVDLVEDAYAGGLDELYVKVPISVPEGTYMMKIISDEGVRVAGWNEVFQVIN